MELIRFYALIVKVALLLALAGMLKTCTLDILGLAAGKSEQGIMSYSKFSHLLTRQ